MKKTRIIFGVNDFLVGGLQQQLVEQLHFFDRNRFEFSIITLLEFPGAPTMYDRIPKDIPVHRFAFKGMFDFKSWHAVMNKLKELQPDIVVSSLFFGNLVFRILAQSGGYRCIAREHNTNVDRPWWQRAINRRLARRMEPIVAVSTTVADFTSSREGIVRQKFVVIHNGIDEAKVAEVLETLPPKEQLRKEVGLSPDCMLLLAVARLVPQKNHRLLLEGFARFRRTHANARLALVGGGIQRVPLEAFVRELNIKDSVFFFGHRDDVARFYKMADAFISTSNIEGLSNAMLEALGTGLPIITTKTAGADEVVREGENGFFVTAPTPEAVEDALGRFAETDHVARGAAARKSVRAFDIRQTVRKYEHLFDEVYALP